VYCGAYSKTYFDREDCMKVKIVALLLFIVVPNMGCAKVSGDFEMTVERIEELKGVILKGVAISGPVKSGCVVNNDVYTVQRDGKNIIVETTARILDVKRKNGTPYNEGEAAVKGDTVHLYIPDAKAEDYKLGDVARSSKTSC
jgi:translation elongation factor EF-1alpha